MKLVQTAEATKNMHTNNADHKKPRKIQAILNMPTPSNEMELQRFLGMITYLSWEFSVKSLERNGTVISTTGKGCPTTTRNSTKYTEEDVY